MLGIICTYICRYVCNIYTYILQACCSCAGDYICTYVHTYVCNVGLGKRFESSNLRSFGTHLKLTFSLRSFTATPTLMFVHAHLCNLNVWSIMWACSRKVEAVLLAAFVSFLCPAMLNPSRNSDRNKTSTRYKAII